MTAWPGNLPQALFFDNLSEVLSMQTAASDMKGMTPQVQEVSKNGLHEITGQLRLSVAQKAIFRTLVYTTLGLCDKFSAPTTFIGDGVAHTFKLLQAPRYKAYADGFIATLNLEVLS